MLVTRPAPTIPMVPTTPMDPTTPMMPGEGSNMDGDSATMPPVDGDGSTVHGDGGPQPTATGWRNNWTAEDLLDHWNDPEVFKAALELSPVNQIDLAARRRSLDNLIEMAEEASADTGTVLRNILPEEVEIIGERGGITYGQWKGGPAGTLNIEFDWRFASALGPETRVQMERAGKAWSRRLLDDFGTHVVTAGNNDRSRTEYRNIHGRRCDGRDSGGRAPFDNESAV